MNLDGLSHITLKHFYRLKKGNKLDITSLIIKYFKLMLYFIKYYLDLYDY